MYYIDIVINGDRVEGEDDFDEAMEIDNMEEGEVWDVMMENDYNERDDDDKEDDLDDNQSSDGYCSSLDLYFYRLTL